VGSFQAAKGRRRGRGPLRPGVRAPDFTVRTAEGPSPLFSVLRRGRHVMVVTNMDPDSAAASPALLPYRDLFEVMTRVPGHAPAFGRSRSRSRTAAVLLVRPDGYVAARERPGELETVLGYLRELSRETATSGTTMMTIASQATPSA
jgi:hypothetical protein